MRYPKGRKATFSKALLSKKLICASGDMSAASSDRRPKEKRCPGVDTESDKVSPTASWKPKNESVSIKLLTLSHIWSIRHLISLEMKGNESGY